MRGRHRVAVLDFNPVIPDCNPAIPDLYPAIPAKAGIGGRPQSRACARRARILTFSHKGLTGVGFAFCLSGEDGNG